MKTLMIFCFILFISLASATNYSITFTQSDGAIEVREILDNNERAYIDRSLLDISSNGYYFTKKITFNESYSNVNVYLTLDKGYYFEKDGIFPEGKLNTDGEKIFLNWEIQNVSKGDSFSMFVKIVSPNNYSLWLFILILVIIIAFSIIFIFFKSSKFSFKKKSGQKKKPKKILYLLDTEKKVIEILKKADKNELWQRKIQELTGFSKAKLSRLIRNLESRGIIEKIPMGNTNKVKLK